MKRFRLALKWGWNEVKRGIQRHAAFKHSTVIWTTQRLRGNIHDKIWFQTEASFLLLHLLLLLLSRSSHAHTHRLVVVDVVDGKSNIGLQSLWFGQDFFATRCFSPIYSQTGSVVRQINAQVHARSRSVSLQSAAFAVNTAPCAQIVSVWKINHAAVPT